MRGIYGDYRRKLEKRKSSGGLPEDFALRFNVQQRGRLADSNVSHAIVIAAAATPDNAQIVDA